MPTLLSLLQKGLAKVNAGRFRSLRTETTPRIASEVSEIPYQNLSGRVNRSGPSVEADHIGGYADVYVGWLEGDDGAKTKVAIKVLRMVGHSDYISKIGTYSIRQMSVWLDLNHPNILKCFGLTHDFGRFGCPATISPYCDNGTANQYLRSHNDIGTRLLIIRGVANGLQYLHEREIIHGDLTPSNILIHDDGRPLLSGFTRARILDQRGFTTMPAGTVRYQAPELLDGSVESSKPTDVYAFVLNSYRIWTGERPFVNLREDAAVVFAIVLKRARPAYPGGAPPGTDLIWGLFEDCWRMETRERPTIKVVVERLEIITSKIGALMKEQPSLFPPSAPQNSEELNYSSMGLGEKQSQTQDDADLPEDTRSWQDQQTISLSHPPSASGDITSEGVTSIPMSLPDLPLEAHSSTLTGSEIPMTARGVETLSCILRDPRKRDALLELKEEQAQLVIDFMDFVLLQSSITPLLRRHITMTLYQLCRTTSFYPQCYVLKGVAIGEIQNGGTFGDIFKGRQEDHTLCLKVMRVQGRPNNSAMLKAHPKETIIWGQLHHPNITLLHGICYLEEMGGRICLVSPWMENGSIDRYVKDNPNVLREPLIYDVALGLEYLHNLELVHSDLKGANILVNDQGRACITDFGLSFLRTDGSLKLPTGTQTMHGCTYRWAAPELLEGDEIRPTFASDIWAFGCVCFEVLTGSLPFHESRLDSQVMLKINRGELPSGSDSAQTLAGVAAYLRDLMLGCWKTIPKERPRCQEIVGMLRSNGIARDEISENQDTVDYHKHFQAHLEKNKVVPVDMMRVQKVLDAL